MGKQKYECQIYKPFKIAPTILSYSAKHSCTERNDTATKASIVGPEINTAKTKFRRRPRNRKGRQIHLSGAPNQT